MLVCGLNSVLVFHPEATNNDCVEPKGICAAFKNVTNWQARSHRAVCFMLKVVQAFTWCGNKSRNTFIILMSFLSH